MFQPSLSLITAEQYTELNGNIQGSNAMEGKDNWVLSHGKKAYSSKMVYDLLMPRDTAPAPMRWAWKSCAMHKHKIFFWVLLQDRLNTRDMLERKNFHVESHDCVLCTDNIRESYMHLFF
jgi:hypothetical protein